MSIVVISTNQLLSGLLQSRLEAAGFDSSHTYDHPENVPASTAQRTMLVHVRSRAEIDEYLPILRMSCPRAHVVLIGPESLSKANGLRLEPMVAGMISEAASADEVLNVVRVVEAGFRVRPLEELSDGNSNIVQLTTAPETASMPCLDRRRDLKDRFALSDREISILKLLRDGRSNKDIAKQLGIVESTVKVHLRSCYSKLRTKNRTQAAIWAAQHLGQAQSIS